MQIECFASSCEGIYEYLSVLSDVQLQEKFWFAKKYPQFGCVEFVEYLRSQLRDLFTTSEYSHFKNSEVMILLEDLFNHIDSYYTNVETAARFCSKNTLLNDPKWLEIQKISEKVEPELKKFIHQLREKMNRGIELAENLFQQMIGLIPTRVELGHGSFITFDFGQDLKSGRGEWFLWVYMCAWRIDKDKKPFIGCEDDREKIEMALRELTTRALKRVEILNEAYDVNLFFGEDMKLSLFSFYTEENEQWMLFTPDSKVFTAGPIDEWSYENAN